MPTPIPSESTLCTPKLVAATPVPFLSHAQAPEVGRKWNLPPTGAAKQHPTPTAQADTRRSGCPGSVCKRSEQDQEGGGLGCGQGMAKGQGSTGGK